MDKRIQRYKRWVNIDFFKSWSNNMAYVLGYFCADGGRFLNSGGSKYIQFVSTDYDQLHNVKDTLSSKHKITEKKRKELQNWKKCYVLQIGSKEMYNDLTNLGLASNKKKNLQLPLIPQQYTSDFVRGYFDGDGCISTGFYKRRDRKNKLCRYFNVKFACGSAGFLKKLSVILNRYLNIGRGSVVNGEGCSWLSYSKHDALKLFTYLYKNSGRKNRLERKYLKFKEAFQACGDVA